MPSRVLPSLVVFILSIDGAPSFLTVVRSHHGCAASMARAGGGSSLVAVDGLSMEAPRRSCASWSTTSRTVSTPTAKSRATAGQQTSPSPTSTPPVTWRWSSPVAGPEYIRNDKDFQRIVRHFSEADKPVAQICHAPLARATAGVLKGRRTAAYPALASDVAQAGAEYVDGAAVVDGLMVSARAWPDHPSWMRAFMEVLRAKAPAT